MSSTVTGPVEGELIHSAVIESRENDFFKNINKGLWRLLEFWFLKEFLFLLCSNERSRQFRAEQEEACDHVGMIVSRSVPFIQTELGIWNDAGNWDKGYIRPWDSNRSVIEEEAKLGARSRWTEMMKEISKVPYYDRHFYPIEDAVSMVEIPRPGHVSVKRAVNYCNYLLQFFSRPKQF